MKRATILLALLSLAGCAAFGPPIDSRLKPYKPAITIEWRERTICHEYQPDGSLRAWTCEVQPGQSLRTP